MKGGKYERMRKFKNWLLNTFCMNELMDFQDYYLGNIRKIENEANRKKFSKYVFLIFMASEAISGKKAEKITAK